MGAPPAARAAETLINFDDVADGTAINTHYPGLTFSNPVGSGSIYARTGNGFAPSAPNVVSPNATGGAPFNAFSSAVDVHFATPMRGVKIDARPVGPIEYLTPLTKRPYLEAYNSANQLIAQVYYQGPLPTNCCGDVGPAETLSYASSTTNIAWIRFSVQNPGTNNPAVYGLFDNLRYDDGFYTLNVNIVGQGLASITPIGPYFYNSTVTVTAFTTYQDWTFSNWSGSISSTQSQLLVSMDTNKNLTATFVKTPQVGPNFVVTTTDDHDDGTAGISDCTLREAINAANAYAGASTITFATNVTGIITLQLGQFTLSHNVTITGPGAQILAISPTNNSSAFSIAGGVNASIAGLNISNFVVGFNANTGISIAGGSTLSMTGCSVSGFRSVGIVNGGTLNLNGCALWGNSGSSGGGVENLGTLSGTNCTISGNGAAEGGAFYNQGTLTLDSCTICSNSCPSFSGGAGGIRQSSGTVSLRNCIVALNINANAAVGPDCLGSFVSLGYNLIGKSNGSTGFANGVNQDQTGTLASPLDPLIGPLTNNGGPTLTHALLGGSPALDKGLRGNGLTTDQRGQPRTIDLPFVANATGGDATDIGAFELLPPTAGIVQAGNTMVISWPTNRTGFTLQSTAQLAPPTTWTSVSITPVIVGNQYTVTITKTGLRQFYRLIEVGTTNVPGLFNTGVAANGALLASGSVDPHWQIVQSPDVSFPGPNAIVVNDVGFPIPPWLANGPASKWLAPQASQATGNQSGDYKYRISFNLNGLDRFNTVINGRWTSDNVGTQVLLNGVATGFVNDGNFGVLGSPFTITSGFVAGVNTLDFVVNNGGTGANPTGVRVELSGTANFTAP